MNKLYINKIAKVILHTKVGEQMLSSSTYLSISNKNKSSLGNNQPSFNRKSYNSDSLNNTLAKSRDNSDLQPLHVETGKINKPTDMGMTRRFVKSTVRMSHLEDKRLTHKPINKSKRF